jgi:hypothetical protein
MNMAKKQEMPKHHWSRKTILASSLWGGLLLALSLYINFLAGTYATIHASNAVSDLILDHIPTFDVDGIFIYGIILFFIFVGILVLLRPRRAPFVMKSFSAFILIRSFFVILTHLGPSLQQSPMDVNSYIVNTITFNGDLFFSGHTGLPFLMALVFWNNKKLRTTFLALSVFFGVVVLMGHLHYSIDVFSAFFITYGIFHISTRLFAKDYHLMNSTKEI